jgi:5'(3')-deoxyribonucleotidase
MFFPGLSDQVYIATRATDMRKSTMDFPLWLPSNWPSIHCRGTCFVSAKAYQANISKRAKTKGISG